MKKLIERILESEDSLTLKDSSNRRYIAGLILEAMKSEGWYLNLGDHRATNHQEQIITRAGQSLDGAIPAPQIEEEDIPKFNFDGEEQLISEFSHLSTDRPDSVKYDGDGKPLEGRYEQYDFRPDEHDEKNKSVCKEPLHEHHDGCPALENCPDEISMEGHKSIRRIKNYGFFKNEYYDD